MPKTKRIGILGGTFNPIHTGHLILAEQAKQILGLEKVLFIPTYLAPHKKVQGIAPAKERLHMVSLAIGSNPSFELSDIELKRGGTSYSIETVRSLKATLGKVRLYFIVGSDFLREFSTWKDIDKLRKICTFAVAQRPGYRIKILPKQMLAIRLKELDISSTDIRQRLKKGKSIRYLVPEQVRKYILKKKLYRS